ncbi:pilus assembly protein TadG-related protein [Sporichthya polymorpha]|uniref:pilus assembly protein TadG-related protein n=1 Tax=Sporichthya polymorpha TaxID=35751 RepID=UPI00036E4892|nr:pilus assembly protein TadG-related protein [Sporichthya polymorpha]
MTLHTVPPAPTRPTPVATRADRRRSGHDDEGSITPFVVVLTSALLAMAGLVVDGGYALAAKQDARSAAEQAARAGADVLARDAALRGGELRLDPAAARAAAERHLTVSGREGDVRVIGQTVTVTVRITRSTAILSAVGIDTLTARATASARGLTGIDREEPLPAIPAGEETP